MYLGLKFTKLDITLPVENSPPPPPPPFFFKLSNTGDLYS